MPLLLLFASSLGFGVGANNQWNLRAVTGRYT